MAPDPTTDPHPEGYDLMALRGLLRWRRNRFASGPARDGRQDSAEIGGDLSLLLVIHHSAVSRHQVDHVPPIRRTEVAARNDFGAMTSSTGLGREVVPWPWRQLGGCRSSLLGLSPGRRSESDAPNHRRRRNRSQSNTQDKSSMTPTSHSASRAARRVNRHPSPTTQNGLQRSRSYPSRRLNPAAPGECRWLPGHQKPEGQGGDWQFKSE
jgi:hypothetical protein